ncbi:hypothetical protein ACLOJK_032326 [Asimina triloba]
MDQRQGSTEHLYFEPIRPSIPTKPSASSSSSAGLWIGRSRPSIVHPPSPMILTMLPSAVADDRLHRPLPPVLTAYAARLLPPIAAFLSSSITINGHDSPDPMLAKAWPTINWPTANDTRPALSRIDRNHVPCLTPTMERDDHEEHRDELDTEDVAESLLTPIETGRLEDGEDMEELIMVIETQPEEGDGDSEDVVYLSLVFAAIPTHPEGGNEVPDESVERLMDGVFEDFTGRRSGTTASGSGAISTSCVEGLERVRFQFSCEEAAAQACAICLNDFSVGTEVVRLPCKHVFDGECIFHWLSMNCTCPLCRFELRNSRIKL